MLHDPQHVDVWLELGLRATIVGAPLTLLAWCWARLRAHARRQRTNTTADEPLQRERTTALRRIGGDGD